jgi:hypothetical protein
MDAWETDIEADERTPTDYEIAEFDRRYKMVRHTASKSYWFANRGHSWGSFPTHKNATNWRKWVIMQDRDYKTRFPG